VSAIAPFPRPAETNGLQAELSAMQAIAIALAQLEDEVTRARVLHWANERFCQTAVVASPVAPEAPSAVVGAPRLRAEAAPDDGLSVSTLEAMFGGPKAHREPSQSVNGLLREFVADFQDVVQEWNAACNEPAAVPSIET
jgi:hypothetical protein